MATTAASNEVGETDLSTSSIEKNSNNAILHSTHPEASPHNMGKFRWILTIGALYSATLLYGLDTTIVANVQVSILKSFEHVNQLTWIGAAFPLGSVAVTLPVGVMYSLFNTKWLYIVSFILFETGSALCGGSPNMNALIVGRVIAGMGGSGMYLG